MKVAFCKEVINPELPCHMEGYADRISEEQHDNLELNAQKDYRITNRLFHGPE
jgi:hypothetical protein